MIDLIEHNNVVPLVDLLNNIKAGSAGHWIIATLRRDLLKSVTNEAFMMVIGPVVANAKAAHIYFAGQKHIHVAWEGEEKNVYKQLRGVITTTLARPGISVPTIFYNDPSIDDSLIRKILTEDMQASGKSIEATEEKEQAASVSIFDPHGWNKDSDEDEVEDDTALTIAPEQIKHFRELRASKRNSRHINVLAVEDLPFYQKLLSEMVRGIRILGIESITMDMAIGIRSAWDLFIKKGHDVVFVDLGLIDGSGHMLSRAIKELDSSVTVIIVTANNHEEEQGVARQNNVNKFLTKPYSKKQIMDCIERHVQNSKGKLIAAAQRK